MAKNKPVVEPKTCTFLGAVEEAESVVEELWDELQEWYDALPDNLQDGEKAYMLQEAIDGLDEALGSLDAAKTGKSEIDDLPVTYIPIVYPKSTYLSREKRLMVVMPALHAINENYEGADLAKVFGTTEEMDEDLLLDAAEALRSVRDAIDSLESVEFPTR